MSFVFRCSKGVVLVRNKYFLFKRFPFKSIYRWYNYKRRRNCLLDTQDFPQVNCLLSTSAFVNYIHTAKGWENIARTGQKGNKRVNPNEAPTSCEKGTDAVPHSVLLNELQSCKTVSEQIETFCSIVSITKKDMENRKQFCDSLTEAFKPYFPQFRVHQFGSSINGLGFKGCDVDVSIQTIFDGRDYLKDVTEVPTLDSIIEGTTSPDTVARLHPNLLLQLVCRIIQRHCPDVREPIELIKARCPILKFYHAKYDVKCDFSCENEFSLRNTKLIRLICRLEERFISLAKFTRYWAKYGNFVGNIQSFSSYGFSLLIVHFLQQTQPPVLPPLLEIIEKSEYLNHGAVNDDELLLKDLKKFQPSKNTQPVEELLKDFFFYFMNFDYSYVMMPLNSSIIPKTSFILNVADTFENRSRRMMKTGSLFIVCDAFT